MTENRIEYSIPMKIVFEMKTGYRLLYSILGVLFTAGALVIPGDDMIITVSKVFFSAPGCVSVSILGICCNFEKNVP